MSPYVLGFDRCNADELTRVGGKSVGLNEMIRAGVPVSPGFVVTTDACKLALASSGLERRIGALLDGARADDVSALTRISSDVRRWIEAMDIPREIEAAIGQSYAQLAATHGQADIAVAVRSSAVAEDLPNASFAGQHDTFLWIRGLDAVVRGVVRCWSSLFTARAISYRSQNGFPHDSAAMGVAVQKMVHARTAGAACTLNPVNGDRSKIVIDASWGFGEAVAQGEVTPDQYVVDKVARGIVKRTVSHKHIEYAVDTASGSLSRRQVFPERQQISCLSDEEVVTIAEIAQRLETHCGQPQCVEWAIGVDLPSSASVVMLQSRPETVWSQRPRTPVSADRVTGVESVLASLLRPLRRSRTENQP